MSYNYYVDLIDPNVVSGSSEGLRTAVGGYWTQGSASSGEYLHFIPYGGAGDPSVVSKYINGLIANYSLSERGVPHKLVENFKIPMRIIGSEDKVVHDVFWEKYMVGGTWEGNLMPGIYNDAVYNDLSFRYEMPYPKIQARAFPEGSIEKEIEISYQYNAYSAIYAQYVEDIDSELLLPNLYTLAFAQSYVDHSSEGIAAWGMMVDDNIKRYITRENRIPVDEIFGNALDESGYWQLPQQFEKYYFTSSITPLSASTVQGVENKCQNLIFDDRSDGVYRTAKTLAMTTVGSVDDRPPPLQMPDTPAAPHYISIRFPMDQNRDLSSVFDSHKFTSKFMKTLKEVFLSETVSLPPQLTPYVANWSFSTAHADRVDDITIAENTTVRSVDFVDMLAYAYNNYLSTTTNCMFLSYNQDYRTPACFDETGIYRYFNTISTQETLDEQLSLMNSEDKLNGVFNHLQQIYNYANVSPEASAEPGAKVADTVAYRIEKIGGAPTGDARTQNVLQNYWISNNTNLPSQFEFFDSQIKYGKNYTYNVYAYVAVTGLKYRLSDLRVTRKIGKGPEYNPLLLSRFGIDTSVTGDPTVANIVSIREAIMSKGSEYDLTDLVAMTAEVTGEGTEKKKKWCLEFYDPETGEAVPQLMDSTDELATLNELSTNAQITDANRYLADFYVNYEPITKIVEIPIFSKTLKVLDHPPNRLNVVPFQLIDDSQTIGFSFNYESFVPRPFPTVLTSTDQQYKEDYMHANNLLLGDLIDQRTTSRQRSIEVYRMSEKPTMLSDFSTHLVETIDLKIKNNKLTYSTAYFYDRIKTNKKYYYLFRVLNEKETPGHLSEVYEAELVNDGGYIYSKFDALYPQDLVEDMITEPTKKFKKLFQLQPNMSQVVFDTSDIDYSQEAQTQLENLRIGSAEELIWAKKLI